jgi:uncharacterized membrane protein YhaH (DUF805 family)
MDFGQSITTCLSKYFITQGRASRSEYWWFSLFASIVSHLLEFATKGIIEDPQTTNFGTAFFLISQFAIVIPSFTVAVRRLHDIGKSGWNLLWVFTGIGIFVLIYWNCQPGDAAINKYDLAPEAA